MTLQLEQAPMPKETQDEISSLQRRWHAMQPAIGVLPSYEDAVLGNLGRHADHTALLTTDGQQPLMLLWSGSQFQEWLGREARDLKVGALSPDLVNTIGSIVQEALSSRAPAMSRCLRTRADAVESTTLLALPLAGREENPFVLLSIEGVASRFSLVDAMFAATDQGMMALAAVRNPLCQVVDFTILTLNDGAARLLDQPATQLRAQALSVVAPHLTERISLQRLTGILEEGRRSSFEVTYPAAGGKRRHVKVEAGCVGDLLVLTLADVTALKFREASFRLLFESNPLPMWLHDPESLRIISANDAAVEHYGYSHEHFRNMALSDLYVEDWEAAKPAIRASAGHHRSDTVWRHRKADGSSIEVNILTRIIDLEETSVVLMGVIDVTERRRNEARIAYLAHHDALTGLPNRVLFQERLGAAFEQVHRSGRSFALLYLDLDGFKAVNDSLGHAGGDELLRHVAQRVGHCLRQNDVPARLGGDEFAILQGFSQYPHDADALARRIVDKLNEPFAILGQKVTIGVSIGIAVAPSDGASADLLLRNADLALYRAKASGRRTYCFYEPGMNDPLQSATFLMIDQH
ncbi:diguanylate cyclase domain-containing protein [Microvirga arabica]|uniref:Diguanylate cyclase domain-containing protein n=1 Tax=Microvirga arabica TaxID=1128671 RepID=A0ABV6YDF8_9HYPH